MEWFVTNQKSLVFSAFVLCAWFLVQMIKQAARHGTDKIDNKLVRNEVNIFICISLSVGAGFLFAYIYTLIYKDANLIWTGVALSATATLSHEIIYKVIRNNVLLIVGRFKAKKDITPKEIAENTKATIAGEDNAPEAESEDKYANLLDDLKKL